MINPRSPLALLLLAACGGRTTSATTTSSDPSDPCTSAEATAVATTNLVHSQTILTDERFIYWTDGDYENVIVRRARKSGGPAMDLATIRQPHPPDVQIASSADSVIVMMSTGRLDGQVLYRVPKSGGEAKELARVAGSPFLVADEGRAYVGTLVVPVDGSAQKDLGLGGSPFVGAVDASRVYVNIDSQNLVGVGFDGTQTEYASQIRVSDWPIGIDATSVYFFDAITPSISHVPKVGGSIGRVVDLDDGHTVCGIFTDDTFVYWCDFQTHAPTAAATWRIPKSASGPKESVLAEGILAMDSSCMYWIGSVSMTTGTIMKKLKPR